MKKSARFYLWIEPELRDLAKIKAEKGDESLARVVRRLLRQWLKEDTNVTATEGCLPEGILRYS